MIQEEYKSTWIDTVSDYFDSNKKYFATLEEESVYRTVEALLAHNGSMIIMGSAAGEYIIDNAKLHLTIYIDFDIHKVRIRNTKTGTDYIFARKFVKKLVNLWLAKKHEILTNIDTSVNDRVQKITDSILVTIEKDLVKQN